MDTKRGSSIVGTVSSYARERGWFFGHFMDEPLLQSELVEVAWQKVPKPNALARLATSTQGEPLTHDLGKGDFYVVWPESVVSDIETDEDTEVLVVRAPSVSNDKFNLPL